MAPMTDSSSSDLEVAETIGRSVRAAYTGRMTQVELGDAIGRDQSSVSQLVNGRRGVSIGELLAIEAACGRPAGWVLRHAGLVDGGPCDVLSALEADPALSDAARAALRAAYLGVVERR